MAVGVFQTVFVMLCLQHASGQCPLFNTCNTGTCIQGERFNKDTGKCEWCENNTYVAKDKHSCPVCTPCTDVDSDSQQATVVRACTASSDTIIDCAPGFYKVFMEKSCLRIACRPCTRCTIRQTEVSPCSGFNDTVCAIKHARELSTSEGKPIRLNAIIVGSVTTFLIISGILVCLVLHYREKHKYKSDDNSNRSSNYVPIENADPNAHKVESPLQPQKWIHA